MSRLKRSLRDEYQMCFDHAFQYPDAPPSPMMSEAYDEFMHMARIAGWHDGRVAFRRHAAAVAKTITDAP